MKRILIILSLLGIFVIGCAKEATTSEAVKENIKASNENKKILVVYHSDTGTTEKVAKLIQEKLGADIMKIEPENPYDTSNLNALKSLVTKQQSNREKIAIKNVTKNIDDYDVIIFGTPAWFSQISPPMITYIDSQNFSNKTVSIFTTYDGVYGDVLTDFSKNMKAKDIKQGIAFSGREVKAGIDKELETWLNTVKQ